MKKRKRTLRTQRTSTRHYDLIEPSADGVRTGGLSARSFRVDVGSASEENLHRAASVPIPADGALFATRPGGLGFAVALIVRATGDSHFLVKHITDPADHRLVELSAESPPDQFSRRAGHDL